MHLAQINFSNLYRQIGQSGGTFTFSSGLTLGQLVGALLPYLFVLAGLLLLLYLLFAGFTYMSSAGDPKKMEDAKGKITGALVGFLIVFVSFWIVQIIGRAFGIQPIIDIFG
ncbi:MAG: hypothetical protein UX19_C0005G0010 [Candidatus Woesebacteria bacterium GW2011_GWA1_45_8]|uniref:Integral membrane protein n=1 Tax=Candidatus Woesebacteria bacterium GW2011_GWA1_45_8 TaxID=1618559 RepID=A0A0G1Q3A3_9BACT|nr:MAG: hypothetical protein UX19_C0005G0010 [Candidatus Woesebacteria bacterium GW2011_GWA1_45_8]